MLIILSEFVGGLVEEVNEEDRIDEHLVKFRQAYIQWIDADAILF